MTPCVNERKGAGGTFLGPGAGRTMPAASRAAGGLEIFIHPLNGFRDQRMLVNQEGAERHAGAAQNGRPKRSGEDSREYQGYDNR